MEAKSTEERLIYTLIDMLFQYSLSDKIDNEFISAFENATDLLAKLGYLKTKDRRIYTLTKKGKKFYKNFWRQ